MTAERRAVISTDEAGLDSLVAFGQYVARADTPDKRGQDGVYGSGAGLEVLASSLRRDHWVQPVRGSSGQASDWRRQILGTWLYLQRRLDPGPGVSPARQRPLVLRQVQVLRALATLEANFAWANSSAQMRVEDVDIGSEELFQPEEGAFDGGTGETIPGNGEQEPDREPEEEEEPAAPEGLAPVELDVAPADTPSAEDYAKAIAALETQRGWRTAAANIEFARVLLAELRKSRRLALDIKISQRSRPDVNAVPGYGFASTSIDLPREPRHWAFFEASVLVAVVRCAWAGILKWEWIVSFWKTEDSALLYDYTLDALNDPEGVDFRVGLFAAWALLHLDPDAVSGAALSGRRLEYQHTNERGRQVVPLNVARSIQLSDDERRNLRSRVSAAVSIVLAEGVRQSDLLEPYLYRLEHDDIQDYRQEHFVVPTLPIVLSLIAHVDDRLLFRPRFHTTLCLALDALDERPIRVVPGQGGGTNGTVNMAYLHEALCEIHDACMRNAARSLYWRLWQSIRNPAYKSVRFVGRYGLGVLSGIALAVLANFIYGWVS